MKKHLIKRLYNRAFGCIRLYIARKDNQAKRFAVIEGRKSLEDYNIHYPWAIKGGYYYQTTQLNKHELRLIAQNTRHQRLQRKQKPFVNPQV